jgi:hypothetical protein
MIHNLLQYHCIATLAVSGAYHSFRDKAGVALLGYYLHLLANPSYFLLTVITTPFDAGVLLFSATLVIGTNTFASGK